MRVRRNFQARARPDALRLLLMDETTARAPAKIPFLQDCLAVFPSTPRTSGKANLQRLVNLNGLRERFFVGNRWGAASACLAQRLLEPFLDIRDRATTEGRHAERGTPHPLRALLLRQTPGGPPRLADMRESEMNQAHRRNEESFVPLTRLEQPRTTDARPMKPDPAAHAEILVLTYGLQTAGWIAETNLATARRSDVPYWSRVLQSVRSLRDARP